MWQLLWQPFGPKNQQLLLQDYQGCQVANLLDERWFLLSFGELYQP